VFKTAINHIAGASRRRLLDFNLDLAHPPVADRWQQIPQHSSLIPDWINVFVLFLSRLNNLARSSLTISLFPFGIEEMVKTPLCTLSKLRELPS